MKTCGNIVRGWSIAAAAVGLLFGPLCASGQTAPGGGTQQVTPARAVPQPDRVPIVTRHPINHRDWTVIVDLRLLGAQPQNPPGTANLRPTERVRFDSATIFFPIPESTAAHETWNDRVDGGILLAGRRVVNAPRLLSGYQSLARLGAWDIRDVEAESVQLHLEVPMTTWEVKIDEARASRVPWPVADWSPDLAACLKPQLLVESDSLAVTRLVERWMRQAPGGPDPKKTPPYVLAKYIAGKVITHYQPASGALSTVGRGRNSVRYSGTLLSGFAVDGAAAAAERGRGPVLDMANLLVASWRAAGIPARVVIGYDNRDEDGSRGPTQRRPLLNPVRAWGEFYLFDEAAAGGKGVGEWVVADVERQREFSSRPPALNQAWKFVGNHEDMDYLCPLSFHWLPPTPCMNIGPPALWGWVPQPEGPLAEPDLRISVKAAARRGDDPKRSTPAPGGGGAASNK